MLSEFLDSEIDFLLVGAYAMAAHGFPRSTGDIDLWVRADPATGPKTFSALSRFGAPLHDLAASDLSQPGLVFQIGVPPVGSLLAKACSYYDAITGDLGNRFRSHVRSAIHSVAERPVSYGRIGGEFRGALVIRIPYDVVFTIDGGIPTIFGLRHAASDRSDWYRRSMPKPECEPYMHGRTACAVLEVEGPLSVPRDVRR